MEPKPETPAAQKKPESQDVKVNEQPNKEAAEEYSKQVSELRELNEKQRSDISKLESDLAQHIKSVADLKQDSSSRIAKLEKLVAGFESIRTMPQVRSLESFGLKNEEPNEPKTKIRLRSSHLKLSD